MIIKLNHAHQILNASCFRFLFSYKGSLQCMEIPPLSLGASLNTFQVWQELEGLLLYKVDIPLHKLFFKLCCRTIYKRWFRWMYRS